MTSRYQQALRRSIIATRNQLPQAYQQLASAEVCDRIKRLGQFRIARNIALYCAVHGEIDVSLLWDAALLKLKKCYFPVVQNDKTLLFLPATRDTVFENNQWGIPEPQVDSGLAISPSALDLIIVPLTAFDEQGHRMGMGAGFYDRTLADVKGPLLLGVAHAFQQQSYISPNPWDIDLDGIVTAKKIFKLVASS